MDITLNPQTTAFVRRKLESGTYGSLSELVNEALYLMLEHEQRLIELKTEIQIGIEQAERGEWIDAETVLTRYKQEDSFMNQLHYFETEDVLHLLIAEDEEHSTMEITPNITAEMNAKGELIGVEILNASYFLRNFVLESVQAKLMNLRLKSEP